MKKSNILLDKAVAFKAYINFLKEKMGMNDEQLSLSVLKAYANAREKDGNRHWVITPDHVEKLITQKHIEDISFYLKEKGLIEYQGYLGTDEGSGRITAWGIDYLNSLSKSSEQVAQQGNVQQRGFLNLNFNKNHKSDTTYHTKDNHFTGINNQINYGKEANNLFSLLGKLIVKILN